MRITTTSKFAIAAALSLAIIGTVPGTAAAIKQGTGPYPGGAATSTTPPVQVPMIVPNASRSISVINPDSMMPVVGAMRRLTIVDTPSMSTAVGIYPKTGTSGLNPDSMMPGSVAGSNPTPHP